MKVIYEQVIVDLVETLQDNNNYYRVIYHPHRKPEVIHKGIQIHTRQDILDFVTKNLVEELKSGKTKDILGCELIR